MRAQNLNPISNDLSLEKVSLSCFVKYQEDSESYSEFPGGTVFTSFSNTTLQGYHLDFLEMSYSDYREMNQYTQLS